VHTAEQESLPVPTLIATLTTSDRICIAATRLFKHMNDGVLELNWDKYSSNKHFTDVMFFLA
jgi:hypothetical protein